MFRALLIKLSRCFILILLLCLVLPVEIKHNLKNDLHLRDVIIITVSSFRYWILHTPISGSCWCHSRSRLWVEPWCSWSFKEKPRSERGVWPLHCSPRRQPTSNWFHTAYISLFVTNHVNKHDANHQEVIVSAVNFCVFCTYTKENQLTFTKHN